MLVAFQDGTDYFFLTVLNDFFLQSLLTNLRNFFRRSTYKNCVMWPAKFTSSAATGNMKKRLNILSKVACYLIQNMNDVTKVLHGL